VNVAKVIAIGQPANDSERKAIAFLRDNLPDTFTILHNFDLRVGRENFEIDIALIAQHAVYMVDIKGTTGEIHVHGGKWYPEGRPAFASPLAKLRHHAKVVKSVLVGSPERPEMKKVYVDAVILLTAPTAFLNDPADVDAPDAVGLDKCVAFFEDTARLPYQPPTNLLSLHGRIIGTLQGGAKPPTRRNMYGDWQIEERLGGTPYYTEFRAFHWRAGPAAGRVSLRVYEADLYQSEADRQKQEKRIATAFTALNRLPTHPGIPSAKAFFHDEASGRFILITEEAPGKALRLHLKKASLALTLDQKIRVVRDVLSALAHLHTHGVLHRAVNPSTVVVGPDGQTRLTDFDFARTGTDRSMTVASEIYAKTEDDAYLAPEIYLDPHNADSAADVYAAATVFYELFTGDKAFPSLKEAVDTECCLADPPSHKNAALPAGFDDWLQRMCAFKAADRPSAQAAREAFDQLLAPPQLESDPTSHPEPIAPTPLDYNDLPAGHQLTHTYIVEKRLGKPGSFGVAYKVIDTLGDVSRVVKIVVKDRTSPVERLKQEYQHLLRVPPHPNVVKVIHADYLPADGRPYLVFEFVDGMDVGEMIESRTLSLPDAFKLATQVVEGLKHLHANGITHCDIKPNNLLWTDQGVKIIDFNVSMFTSNPNARGGGSKKYLPPDMDIEDEMNDADRCDRDLFALGVTVYQAVTGRYPWEQPGVPVPGHAAPDPRSFPECAGLSQQLVEVMLKAIAPHRLDRYRDAAEMASALNAVKSLRQAPVTTQKSTSTLRWEDLAGDTPPQPNTNPFVTYLKTVYSQNNRTNAGVKGIDRLGGRLYVETALDTHLAPAVLDGQYRLVIISGNAGDGKTAFLQKMENEAKKRGEHVDLAPGGNGAIFKHRNRRFLSNYDGSQDEGDKGNDAVLLDFLGPFLGAKDAVWPDNETRVIAINEGRLIDFLEIHTAKFTLLKAIVTRGLRSCNPEHGVAVVNLNLRSVIAAKQKTEDTIYDRLLTRYTDPKFWAHCANCDIRNDCYAYHNAQTFQDVTGGPQVHARLRTLYTLTSLRGKLHITLRDLSSALAFTLTSARDCQEIHSLYQEGKRSQILEGFYFNSWMGGEEPQADRLLKLLSELDVGNVSEARIDRNLDFRQPTALPALMDFEARNGVYDRQVLQSLYASLPADPSAADAVGRFARHQHYVRSMRRLHFFECRDESWRALLPYQSADRMLRLIDGAEPLATAVPRLIRAMNRGEGLFDPHRLKGKLALQVRRVENGTIRCYRVFSEEGFSVHLRDDAADCPYLENAPAGLILSFDGAKTGKGEQKTQIHADMAINLDIYEMLERLNQGYRPTVEEIQGFWLSLNVFKNILSSAPYQEVLLTSTGHDFYSVERESDGKLIMKLAESGGEYATAKEG
jgi:serine/threonine protein kinase